MHCEFCKAKAARVHITHKFVHVTTELKAHLCEECAPAYQQEFTRFRQQLPIGFRKGMSTSEKEAALKECGETVLQHMTEWTRRGLQNDAG